MILYTYRIFTLLLVSLVVLLTSCSGIKYMENIVEIKEFDTTDKNQKLGMDILYYNYQSMLLKEIPGLTKQDLSGIFWQIFTQDSNKKVYFKTVLHSEYPGVGSNRDTINGFFRAKVPEFISYHINNDSLFNEAITFAHTVSDCVENEQFGKMKSLSHPTIAGDDNFKKIIKGADNIYRDATYDSTTVTSKQHYNGLDGLKGDIFFVNLHHQNDTLHKYERVVAMLDSTWSIAGYHFNFKKKK
ncbi:MAG: hypothetical protein OCD01_19450 [Fibrobacterales bacterium]